MSKPKKVFVVDDDEIFSYVIQKIMEDMHQVDEIKLLSNGTEALTRLRDFKDHPDYLPDLILLDLSMPIMDGWGFLNEFEKIISEVKKAITIIVYTSSINPVDMERAKKYSCVKDYVVKPIERESTYQFIKKVSEVLNNI
jgi:CheY-like chemotaxis protein